MSARIFIIATTLGLTATTAIAQPVVREDAAISIGGSAGTSHRSMAGDWMIMPKGSSTVSGSLGFVTADSGLGESGLKFTDVVLATVRARSALTRRIEIFGSTTFLPKQPSFTEELVWQSGSAGGVVGFGKRYAAFASASGGLLMGDRGTWASGGLGVQARKSLHETLLVEGSAAGAYTSLFEDKRDQPSWLAEVVTRGQLIFRVPNGMMAGWLGTEFRVPLAHDSSMSSVGEMPYRPQTRVNFEIGTVLSYIEEWDIWAKVTVNDRGDIIDPTTTLPILEGGFDQKQLIIGMTRRFAGKDRDRSVMIAE